MDSPLSLNAMRALQAPNTQQPGGTQNAGGQMDPSQLGSQIVNAALAFLKNLAAGAKDGKNDMSQSDKDQSKLAINGVQGGRLNQERGSMA